MTIRTIRLLTGLLVFGAVLWIAGLTILTARAETPAAAHHTREITNDEILVARDLMMQSKNHEAIAYLHSLENECAGEPLYLLTRARILQSFITTVDDGKEYAKELSGPALATLDEVIEICSNRMEAGDDDPSLLLYRGWAWMQKAHLRALARAFYTAGRDAGRGKKDLEEYLGHYADDSTANGLLGAYLYFTDAVPKVFKFLSKLLFLPTGDRARGLEMIHRSAGGESPFVIDYALTLNFVNFFFEGRIEEGLAGTEELMARYPHYTRATMALAVASPYAPTRHIEYNRLIKRMIAGVNAGDTKNIDWNSLYTVLAFRAYADRFLSNPKLAEVRFRSIIHESPNHPDWVNGFARFELGQIYAAGGRVDEARELFQSVVDNRQHGRFHDQAKRMLDDLERYDELQANPPVSPDGLWIEAVYRSGPDSLETLAARFETLAPASLPAAFYVGECRMLLGESDAATRWYERVIEWDAPAWQDTYRMIASTRVAEIHALDGDYLRAAEFQARALDFYQNEYRIDWIIEGRQGYFERLAEGVEALPTPTLLSPSRAGAAFSPGD
jgi:tetratricopeptide (TPR) repeat protein